MPRSRPPRSRTLSRDRIIAAAKVLGEREGADRLTIRALASELDVSPMAIYRHVGSKSEILGLLVDAFIEDAAVLAHDEPYWLDWMLETARRMRSAMAARPELLPLLGDAMVLGVPAMQAMDRCLQVLQQAGFPREPAVCLFMQVIQCLMGSVMLEAAARKPRESASKEVVRVIERSDMVRAAVPTVQRVLSGELLDAMLRDLLEGAARQRGVL